MLRAQSRWGMVHVIKNVYFHRRIPLGAEVAVGSIDKVWGIWAGSEQTCVVMWFFHTPLLKDNEILPHFSMLIGHAGSFVSLVGLVPWCPALLFGQGVISHLSQLVPPWLWTWSMTFDQPSWIRPLSPSMSERIKLLKLLKLGKMYVF